MLKIHTGATLFVLKRYGDDDPIMFPTLGDAIACMANRPENTSASSQLSPLTSNNPADDPSRDTLFVGRLMTDWELLDLTDSAKSVSWGRPVWSLTPASVPWGSFDAPSPPDAALRHIGTLSNGWLEIQRSDSLAGEVLETPMFPIAEHSPCLKWERDLHSSHQSPL